MKKFLISAAAAAIMAGAAYAQTATEFYVVQDTSTKKCTIVDKKPTIATTVVVGDGKVFKSRTAAETGMKTMKVCAN
jgi:NAD(P)H-dependent flavin oxidoreductase YrpB (nitropropane dioxygenase family)